MKFYKMHGAGNDFVMLTGTPKLSAQEIQKICHRQTGIGADGLIFIEAASETECYNFIMHYYNSDGSKANFCGNGARCALQLAYHLEYFISEATLFLAGDGNHFGRLNSDGSVSISINSPRDFKQIGQIENIPLDLYFVNTGVEHVVAYTDNLASLDVVTTGRKIRYAPIFPNGTNVNFISTAGDGTINIRTYERGVENETLACGTGISAAAFTDMQIHGGDNQRKIHTVTGYELTAGFEEGVFMLTGPAVIVAEGEISENWLDGLE